MVGSNNNDIAQLHWLEAWACGCESGGGGNGAQYSCTSSSSWDCGGEEAEEVMMHNTAAWL